MDPSELQFGSGYLDSGSCSNNSLEGLNGTLFLETKNPTDSHSSSQVKNTSDSATCTGGRIDLSPSSSQAKENGHHDLPRASHLLSPRAPPFIPATFNPFRILEECKDTPQEQASTGAGDEIERVDYNSTSRLLKLNALEDVALENDEPALYTHSEGEKKALNDSTLGPCRFKIRSSSASSMSLPKLSKGRKTSSPSHMVTRSRAKLLAAGRRKTPIRGVDTSDEEGESFAEGIRTTFKESCPTIKTKKPSAPAPDPPTQPKLTKNQKKKAKMKLRKARTAETQTALQTNLLECHEHSGYFDEEYDFDYGYVDFM